MERERRSIISVERLDLEFYYGQEADQFTFYRLPKALIVDARFKDISNNAKLLYGLMLDRMSLSARSGWFDEENRVFIKYAITSIMEDLNCSKMTAVGALKELNEIGLIDMVQESGKANIIYVKNFVSQEKPQPLDRSKKQTGKNSVPVTVDQSKNKTGSNNRPVQKEDEVEIYTGTCPEIGQPPVEKLDPNNTKVNNIKLNNTNPIIQSAEDMMDETEAYMELIRENIDYDVLMSDPKWRERDMYEELYQLICEVVCVPRKTIRIAGQEYPYNLVKGKFLKLNSSHLQYVIGYMERNTTKVSNIKAYLITALYNAPNTISHYYTAEVNHDMYGFDPTESF